MSCSKVLVLIALTAILTGCTSLAGGRWGLAALRPGKEQTAGDRSDDPWVDETGEYTRLVHPREEIHDPLNLRNMFTSEKARDIERNLGVGP